MVYNRSFIWEILQNTLNKVVSRVAQVKAKLNNFQSLHETNKAKRAESEMNECKRFFLKKKIVLIKKIISYLFDLFTSGTSRSTTRT
jgi:hypothetical protein